MMKRLILFFSCLILCVSLLFGANFAEATPRDPMNLPHESFVLDNGLRVFLIQDSTLPLVSVNLWFDVGSKDERAGRTGFAHLFEHLMFMGTEAVPNIDILLETGGGSNNASTREDATNYYTVAPENMLETVLFIEADRLAHLGQAMTQEKLDRQREIVLNERKQTHVNQPYGKLWLELPSVLYPDGHPYQHPVIGSEEDIRAATVSDVIDFFNTYYVPANATLVIAGDFENAKAKAWVQKYFGVIPKSPKPQPVSLEQLELPNKSRLLLSDAVELPKIFMLWHSPAYLKPGDAELDILSSILCKGKNSRLVKELVYEKQMASGVSCFQMSALNSAFYIDATPLPGHTVEEVESAILSVLRKILEEGITKSEFDRTKNSIEMNFVKQMESLGSRADLFNQYYFYTGSTEFPEGDRKRYADATPESTMEIFKKIFSSDEKRATIIIRPNESSSTPADSEH